MFTTIDMFTLVLTTNIIIHITVLLVNSKLTWVEKGRVFESGTIVNLIYPIMCIIESVNIYKHKLSLLIYLVVLCWGH